MHRGARNTERGTSLGTLYLKHGDNRDRWRQVHTLMTLRLDTEAGKHRALKGETKLGN